MSEKRKILKLISEIRKSHSEIEQIYKAGSCLNFYKILRVIYPNAIPYYNIDHVITRIGDTYYDIGGEITNVEGYLPFKECYNARGRRRAFRQMLAYEYKIEN